jgi:hypothetical protein
MSKSIINLLGRIKKNTSKRYIKLDRNQLFILDALLEDGAQQKFLDSKKKKRFSEYSGYIDIFKGKVQRIIVNTNQGREDEDDTTILLPNDNLQEIINYEYIFHTHPPSPIIGARVPEGILYEFPSISDLLHFCYYHNNGLALGSLILAPEGLYMIYATEKYRETRIDFPKKNLVIELEKIQFKINEYAIKKYGVKFSTEFFYSKIAQDRKYYSLFKKAIHKYFNDQITISYISRKYDNNIGKWILDNVHLRY